MGPGQTRPGFANFSSIFGRSRTGRTRRPFYPLALSPLSDPIFLFLSFSFVLSFVEIRRDSLVLDDRTRVRRSEKELHPEKRLAFGADGTPCIVSLEARLERTMEKSVSLRAFVTRTAG